MNVFFVSRRVAITPPLTKTILAGVTRDSVLTLLHERGTLVEERPIAIDEILEAHKTGDLTEAFGAGTAAIVAPTECISYRGREIRLPAEQEGSIGKEVRRRLQAILTGRETDKHGWLMRLLRKEPLWNITHCFTTSWMTSLIAACLTESSICALPEKP